VWIDDFGRRRIYKNVINKLILNESVEEENFPLRVVGWKVVEEDGNHGLDVEDDNGMHMKCSYHYMGMCIGVHAQGIIVIWRRRWRIRPVQHELGTCGVLSSPGSFSGKTIGLSHQAISLSDCGRAGISDGFGGRCGDAISFITVGVGVAGCCELDNVSHEETRSGRRGHECTGRKRRREAVRLKVDVGARVA
jgi:hypothetical protein